MNTFDNSTNIFEKIYVFIALCTAKPRDCSRICVVHFTYYSTPIGGKIFLNPKERSGIFRYSRYLYKSNQHNLKVFYTISDTQKNQRSKVRLALVVNGDSKTDSTTTRKVTTNTTSISLSRSVGVVDRSSVRSDRRASATQSITDAHTLHRQASILRHDSRDIESRPATVRRAGEVKLSPCGRISAVVISGDGARSSSPSTARVVVKGNVLGVTGGEFECESGVAVPAGHLAVGAALVEEDDSPGLLVLALELGDVLVVCSIALGHLDHVAAPGVAGVASVGNATAAAGGAAAEALGGVGSAGGSSRPGSTTAASGRGRGSGGGARGGRRSDRDKRGRTLVDVGQAARGEGCQQHESLGKLHFESCLFQVVASSDLTIFPIWKDVREVL